MNQTLTVQIPAVVGGVPGIFYLPNNFKIFSCISTDGTYSAVPNTNLSPYSVDQAGRGFGTATGVRYGNLTLKNSTAAIITTTIYVGDDPIPQSVIPNDITTTATIAQTTVATAQKLITIAVANTAIALGAAGQNFVWAKILAFKTAARGANTGDVFIGASGTGVNQPILMAAGDEVTIQPPSGYIFRFQDWYLNGANVGDSVVIEYASV